jgi:hypothetical protein
VYDLPRGLKKPEQKPEAGMSRGIAKLCAKQVRAALAADACRLRGHWIAVPEGGSTMKDEATHETRLERILGVPLAEDAVRQWPQSGELLRGRARIGEVESYFKGLRFAVGSRLACGDTLVVEWTTDYGDGRLYRNVSIAELRDGKATGQ